MEDDLEMVTNKKDTLFERLNKRNKDRQNYLETQQEIRNKEHTKIEDADYFSQIFSEKAKEIEKNINNVEPKNADLTRIFAGINGDIQELQRYLSNSTLFLPEYNIKSCQNILNELTAKSEELKAKLIPKKRFGFNSKKIVLKTSIKNGIDKVDFNEKSNLSASTFEWTLSGRKNEHILLIGSEVDRKDITISEMKNCLIEIRGHAGSLQISHADNCVFLCGPITRSIFAEYCNNITISAACQQLRLHSSINCKLWLHVTCRAIIEDCAKIQVGKYNYEYSGIEIDFKKSGLDQAVNNYKDIADFNWLSPEKPSPNWKLADDEDCCDNIDWTEVREKFKINKKL